MGVDRKKGLGVARAKTVGHLWEGIAVAEETIFQLSVVEEGENVEDGGDFLHSCGDDVTGEGDVPYRSSKELKTFVGSPRDAAVERVED